MLTKSMSVRPVSDAVGAEIIGVDLGPSLSDREFKEILSTWHAYGVVVIREQKLTKKELIAFSARFGTPEKALSQERKLSSEPEWQEVLIVSNVVEDGVPIGHLGNKEALWHTDMCYTDQPPIASIMHSIEVPRVGGDTGFMNMYSVYERLPTAVKKRIANLSIKHDRSHTAVGDLRHGYDPVVDVVRSPGSVHPIVQTHPMTGRKVLYLGRRLNAYIVGLPVPESEALLDRLWEYTNDPQFSWHHKWRVGDVVIWDNRCLMHRRDAFDPATRRVMWRTQVQAKPEIAA